MSLDLFEKIGFSPTNIVTKTANYTALATDDQINITGSGVVLTLPALNTLQATMTQKKMYAVYNNGATYDLSIQPGTNTVTNTADTINSRATLTLKPKELVVISGDSNLLDWKISSPKTLPTLLRNNFSIVATTNGTTPVNVFDANGAPDNLNITAILTIATVTLAGNLVVKNGTDTMATIAKSTTIGAMTAAAPSAVANVAKGAVFTVEMGAGSEDVNVIIFGSTQTLVSFAN
jgi:hypothetical protein